MKAYLRSVRIAPKKANIIAMMVRGMPVGEAMHALARTHKKGARMVEQLIKSAVANAEHNDKQDGSKLVIKTIVVNQSMGYRRGTPKARGQMRPMTKFMSHISVALGVAGEVDAKPTSKKKSAKAEKTTTSPSQKAKTQVKTSGTKRKTSASSDSDSVSA